MNNLTIEEKAKLFERMILQCERSKSYKDIGEGISKVLDFWLGEDIDQIIENYKK